jgi:HD-like signal output (HDOD) protein
MSEVADTRRSRWLKLRQLRPIRGDAGSPDHGEAAVKHVPQEARPDVTGPGEFIQQLSRELAAGEIRLPSFPDIAVRVQKVLEDPRAPRTQVAQVIGADAALAARVLRLANSAFFRPSSHQITDLQQALTRLGNQLVRCTAVSFSMQQMTLGSGAAQRAKLQKLWRQGALVASIAYVIAREQTAAIADEALMTGLMHNIGRLYLAVSQTGHSTEEFDSKAWTKMVEEWHPRIAGAILKHWNFPPAIVAAVANQNDWQRECGADDVLSDVLVAGVALQFCVFDRDLLEPAVAEVPAFRRLRLSALDCQRLLAATGEQIKALQAALAQ